jgi:16S rRNA (guanine527-N7)-methyltransferase
LPRHSPTHDSQIEPRIRARLEAAGYELPRLAVERLATHLALTLKWAAAISLTSIRSLDEAIDRHVLESLAVSTRVEPATGPLLDIGSGNGYPAIPIKIVRPEIQALLLEPHLRRSIFLRRVVTALSLDGIEVRRERVEAPEDLVTYSPLGSITMRGVAVVPVVLQGALRSLERGGRIVLLLGERMAMDVEENLPAGLDMLESSRLPFRSSARMVVIRRA